MSADVASVGAISGDATSAAPAAVGGQPSAPRGHHHPGHVLHGRPGAFAWSVALNAGLMALQLAVGLAFGSLALVGEALHKLLDVASLLLAWAAERLSLLPPSRRFTWGLGRTTQLAVLINASLIAVAGALLVREAMGRLQQPVALEPLPVVGAALAGLLVNLLAAWLFGDQHQRDLNRRAAVLHLLTDAAVMAAVLLSTVLVALSGRLVLDAITALAVGLLIAWNGLRLLVEGVALSLDGVPASVDLAAVEQVLQGLPQVQAVQHLHVWALSTASTALSAHLLLAPAGLAQQGQILQQARRELADLGIVATTLELEIAAADQAGQARSAEPPFPQGTEPQSTAAMALQDKQSLPEATSQP